MHWTAFLAYRRFPPSARVIDDLPCIACGYNLRGIRLRDRCPECGGEIGDSLFVLAKPEIVGRALTGIARSYVGALVWLFGCTSAAIWAPMVTGGVLVLSSIWRLFHAAELRYRGAVAHLPVIGWRVQALWHCAIIEGVVSLAYLGIGIVFTQQQGTGIVHTLNWLVVAWMMTMWLCVASSGWLGHPFAVMLGYRWMAIEFSIQQALAAMSAGAGVMLLLMIGLTGSSTASVIVGAVFALLFGGAIVLTFVALLQLSNAAHKESDTWDDAIDVYAEDPPSPAREADPVQLSPREQRS